MIVEVTSDNWRGLRRRSTITFVEDGYWIDGPDPRVSGGSVRIMCVCRRRRPCRTNQAIQQTGHATDGSPSSARPFPCEPGC